MTVPRHFDGKRFFNPDAPAARGLWDVLRWKWTTRPDPSPRFVADVEPSRPPSQIAGPELLATLVNHSTVLLQQRGLNILTDPIWSGRAGPAASLGPRRRRDPGVRWEDVPPIHLVLLSHNHYDHLDLSTLQRLTARGASQFIAPIGVGRLLRAQSIGPVHELDWGESFTLPAATVHSVPAFHFSGRGLFDRDRTLWCGYVVETPGRVVYFAGDTAFGPHFAAIRDRFGQPRLALLPIGAYEPRWFMSAVHMSPAEAVRAHQILAARTSIAIHHGTFQLADDALNKPPRLVRELADPTFLTLNNGQSVILDGQAA